MENTNSILTNRSLFDEKMWVNNIENQEKRNYHFYSVSEFLKLKYDEQIVYLDPLVRSESIVLITGSGGVGKTMFVLGFCKSLVSGEKFGDWEIKNTTKVLYIDGELPISVFSKRVMDFGIGDDLIIMSSSVDRDTTFSLNDEYYRNEIKKYLIENHIKVCVFDNLSSLTPGLDENSKREYDPINQYFMDLRRHGVTSIIVHHTGKNKKEQRGTSGRTDNIDIWINLEKVETDDETLKVKVHPEKWRYERPIGNNLYFTMDNYTYTWSCSSSNNENGITDNERMILTLIDEGKTQRVIKTEVGVSQPFVSKTLKKYKGKGVLDENGKLTDIGKKLLEIQ